MLRPLKIAWLHVKLSVLNELQYRANFVAQVFQSVASLALSLIALQVVFRHTSELNGWDHAGVLAVVGVFMMLGGVVRAMISPSMNRMVEEVRTGALDFALLKPVDAQFFISVRVVHLWSLFDIALGAIVLGVAVARLGAVPPADAWLLFALTFLASCFIVYGFWMMLATLSFWFVRLINIFEVWNGLFEAARWPTAIYPGWLRFILTFIVPVAFAVTVPASALAKDIEVTSLFAAIGLAMIINLAARLFWRIGLSHYTGASA